MLGMPHPVFANYQANLDFWFQEHFDYELLVEVIDTRTLKAQNNNLPAIQSGQATRRRIG